MAGSNVRSVRLRWEGEGLVFHGGPEGGAQITVDGDGAQGQSPMNLLLMSVAGCMAIDVVMILEKGRVPVRSIDMEAIGVRAEEAPKRYLSLELIYRIEGPSENDQPKIDRAIELSRDKFCSVLHTLDAGIDVKIRVERV